jgi:hypothetical protein
VRLIILKSLRTIKDYVADVVVIWQLEDGVAIDDVDIMHVKRMDYSGSHKYRYRGCKERLCIRKN